MSTATSTAADVVIGSCHHDCPDTCGWHVTVDRSGPTPVALQMRGNPDHPVQPRRAVPEGQQVPRPGVQRRTGAAPAAPRRAKGEGRFEQITWDEALAEIAARFHAIIAEHGAEAIMPYSDAGNQSLLAMGFPERFWNKLGATRVLRAICGPTVGAGVKMTNGTTKGLDPMEIRHSKLILLWGTNTKLTNRHLWPTIEAARADGAQVVVIDPIRTMTADDADWFIQPLPGTDIALMLAMMHVLIRDGLTDERWVAEHTVGFDELAAHVAEWTPERAAATCGVAAADIERLATMYGTVRPAVIRTLVGAEHHENGAMFFRTMACLPALIGAWQRPWWRPGPLDRGVGRRLDRQRDVLQRPGPARRSSTAVGQHEPPRRDPRRHERSADPRSGGVELQPDGDHPERREDPRRRGARRPVHGRPRAVHHRHGALRRHRPAGHHPDRSHRRRAAVGPPLAELERSGDRAMWRVGQQQRAVPPAGQGDGLHRSRSCSTTT